MAQHVIQGLERQIGIDGARAVAEQDGEMMHFARLTRFDHETDSDATSVAHQMMVHAGGRERSRDRCVLAIDPAIRQDDEGITFVDRGIGRRAHRVQRALQAGRAFTHRVNGGNGFGAKAQRAQVAQLLEIMVVDHRRIQLDLTTTHCGRGEQIAFRTDRRAELGHQLFANAVERRIGDLCEQLLEIVVEQARAI